MPLVRRKVVRESLAYGRRGGEYRVLHLECGHTVERHWKRIYPSQEEECGRCSNPEFYIRELGLSPTQEDALRRLYRDGRIDRARVFGNELRALNALVTKGFVVVVESEVNVGSLFKLPD